MGIDGKLAALRAEAEPFSASAGSIYLLPHSMSGMLNRCMSSDGRKTGLLFFGIGLPESVRKGIDSKLPRRARGLRLTKEENLHLTLRFVGEVDSHAMYRVREDLVSLLVERFTLPLEGGGRFPPRGAMRVVWVGLGAGHPRLFQLRKEIDDTLLKHGVEVDLRDFVPHATLVRVEPGGQGAGEHLLREFGSFEGPVISVSELLLFDSKPSSEGPEYSAIQRFPLRGTSRFPCPHPLA